MRCQLRARRGVELVGCKIQVELSIAEQILTDVIEADEGAERDGGEPIHHRVIVDEPVDALN